MHFLADQKRAGKNTVGFLRNFQASFIVQFTKRKSSVVFCKESEWEISSGILTQTAYLADSQQNLNKSTLHLHPFPFSVVSSTDNSPQFTSANSPPLFISNGFLIAWKKAAAHRCAAGQIAGC